MKMKIVQLEGQSERSLSAKNAFERYADVTLVQTATVEGLLRELEGGDVDLVLCHPSDIPEDILALLSEHAPDVPVVLLASDEERWRLLQDASLTAWDVVSPSEMDRLPLSAKRAIQSRRERRGLRDEVTQARELLLSCQKSIAVGRLLGRLRMRSITRSKPSRISFISDNEIFPIKKKRESASRWPKKNCSAWARLPSRCFIFIGNRRLRRKSFFPM